MVCYASSAIDLCDIIFSCTDKAVRNEEYDNLIGSYHDSWAKSVKFLGSDPEKLFTLENLKDELKRCGNMVLIMMPMLIQLSLADSSEIVSKDEMFSKPSKEENKSNWMTGLSNAGQQEHDRRLNEIFEDVIERGYYQKIE